MDAILPTRFKIACLAVFLAMLAGGCEPALRPGSAPEQAPFFRPPTPPGALVTPAAQPAAPGASQRATPVVQCQAGLTFLSDLTIPDGTTVSPGAILDKRWEVENSGNCNWGSRHRVRLIAGPEMNARKEQALFPARSGTRAVIRIQFTAPAEPGAYRSAWQAFDEQGAPFGDPFFIDITVQ
jgi:hypothetical protein